MSDIQQPIMPRSIPRDVTDAAACYNTILCLSRGLAAHFDLYVSPGLAAESMRRSMLGSAELHHAFEPTAQPDHPFRVNNFICRVDPMLQNGEIRFKLNRRATTEPAGERPVLAAEAR